MIVVFLFLNYDIKIRQRFHNVKYFGNYFSEINVKMENPPRNQSGTGAPPLKQTNLLNLPRPCHYTGPGAGLVSVKLFLLRFFYTQSAGIFIKITIKAHAAQPCYTPAFIGDNVA